MRCRYPYGEEITSTNNDTYKFAQTYRDSDSGLDYAMSRFYGSGLGRFLSADRIGAGDPSSPQTLNGYNYANGNPVNMVDPFGRDACGFDIDPMFCFSLVSTVCAANSDFIDEPDLDPAEMACEGLTAPEESLDDSSDEEPVTNCLSAFLGYQVGFVAAHYTDSVTLGTKAGLPSTWVLGWSAQESGFGGAATKDALINRNPNNYFSWHGQGNVNCPPTANKTAGCFSSYLAAGNTALFSTQNYFNYGGKKPHTGTTAASILASMQSKGPIAAFDALQKAGYTPSKGYGKSVDSDIGIVQNIEDCLSSLNGLPKP